MMKIGSEGEETERAETDPDEAAAFRIPTRTSSRRRETFGSRTSTSTMSTRETMSATDADQKTGGETEDKRRRKNIPDQEGWESWDVLLLLIIINYYSEFFFSKV